MRGSISPKSHTLQLFLLKKLPKVYRIKSSNTYRAKQGYTVTEGFLNRKSGIFGFVVSDYYQTEGFLNLVSNKVNKRMIKRVIDELNWACTGSSLFLAFFPCRCLPFKMNKPLGHTTSKSPS